MAEVQTVTLHLSEFSTINNKYASAFYTTRPINAAAGTSTYADFMAVKGNSAESVVYYKVDTSSIPDNAIIRSISFKSVAYVANTNIFQEEYLGLSKNYALPIEGDRVNLAQSYTKIETVNCSVWSREELDTMYFCSYLKRGTTSANSMARFRIYPADIIIEYEIPSETLYLKVNGQWKRVKNAQHKIFGWAPLYNSDYKDYIPQGEKIKIEQI